MCIIDIIGYKQTTFQKIVQANNTGYYGAGPSVQKVGRSFVWKNTAAITELTFTAGVTAFVDGSVFTLYGIG